jgi:hypothetical protein
VLDEVLLLFDQAVSGRESAAKQKVTEALAERAKGGENRQALLDEILTIVLDPAIGDEQIGPLLRGWIGMDRMRAAWAEKRERLPRDHGHLAMMDASMTYLRQFAPSVLRAVRFAGGPGIEDLLAAVAMLAGLYATGARKVPAGAPVGFVPTKWAGYLAAAAEAGDATAYRRYWEIAVLVGLRDGLRSGDVFVPGSRRYADPASFLLTAEAWAPQKVEFCHLVGKPVEAADALAQADDELHTALADLETQLAKGNPGEVRLTDDGELIIPPLTAEDVPGEADALRAELAQMLPRVPIASVLVEVDARTGFTDHLVHAGGKVNRPAELKRNLLYVIIAEATNGPVRDGRVLRRAVRRARLDRRVVPPPGDPGGGQRRGGQLPPPAAPHAGVRLGHPVQLGRATVSGQGQVHHRPAPVAALRPRPGRVHLHPRVRPALHLRHQGHRGHGSGIALRARRAAGQRDRPADLRARHRHPRRHPGQLRAIRPGRQAAVPADPRPGNDHPVPHRAPGRSSWPATRGRVSC